MHNNEIRLSQTTVRWMAKCPRCGRSPGLRCIGRHGDRHSTHEARVRAALRRMQELTR